MNRLTFSCPQTGRQLDPEITTDADSLRLLHQKLIRLECPDCRRSHILPVRYGRLTQAA
jgi:hypothetical protein